MKAVVVPTPISGVGLTYYGRQLKRVYIHPEFLSLLAAVLEALRIKAGVYQMDTAGIYNLRKARGSQRLSLHAYASAIDILGVSSHHLTKPLSVSRDWESRRQFWELLEFECTKASKGYRYQYITPDTDPIWHKDHVHWGIWPMG